jgi:hypothetical protein
MGFFPLLYFNVSTTCAAMSLFERKIIKAEENDY